MTRKSRKLNKERTLTEILGRDYQMNDNIKKEDPSLLFENKEDVEMVTKMIT